MKIFCDIWTGALKKSANGPLLGPLNFYIADILPLELGFLDGTTDVTATVLAAEETLRVGIKAYPGAATLLALASDYTISGGLAVMVLSLNTTELLAYFQNSVAAGNQSCPLHFEIQVVSSDESTRVTYHQSRVVVNREVNQSGDPDPVELTTPFLKTRSINFRAELTERIGGTSSCLDSVATILVTPPVALLLYVDGTGELWTLAAGDDAEDGVFIVRPDDYDPLTNIKVWKRIL